MTTIVFHKGILATDSRSSVAHAPTAMSHVCQNCGDPGRRVNDTRDKLVLVSGSTYEGEPILCFAGAGSGAEIRRVGEIMKANFAFDTVEPTARLLTGFSPFKDMSLLLVLKDKTVVLRWSPGQPTSITRKPFSETVVLGSGSKAALLAIELFNCTAVEAVKMAMLADESTGGHIDHLDLTQEVLKLQGEDPPDLKTFKLGFGRIPAIGVVATESAGKETQRVRGRAQKE